MKRPPSAGSRCVLAVGSLALLFAALSTWHGAITLAVEPAEKEKTVKLEIDFGDGVQKHFTQLAWQKEMTILDLLNAAAKHPRGIRFEQQGSGATAFLTKIDDLKNEGRGRNWIYRVNDKLGDRSFATVSLQAGDVVLWKFGEYK